MKTKSDYIKELEEELLEEYVIPERKEDDTSKSEISKKMSDKSGISKGISKVKRKISGIRGIKPIDEFPYDIDEFDRIDFEYDNLVIKGKKSYYRYAIIALLALGAVTLKKNPVHLLTDRMQEVAMYKEDTNIAIEKPKTDGTPISVSSTIKLQKIKNNEIGNGYGIQGFTFIDKNHFAVAEINRINGYLSVYDMSKNLISTTKATTHNNSIQADEDNSAILSIGGTETGGSQHQMYELDYNNYKLSEQKAVKNRHSGCAIGMDSYDSKDYVITVGRKTWFYLCKRKVLWNRKSRNWIFIGRL